MTQSYECMLIRLGEGFHYVNRLGFIGGWFARVLESRTLAQSSGRLGRSLGHR